jgi:hypothetical protein
MTWFMAILGVLKAFPDFVSLFKEFMVWLNHVSGNDPQGYVQRLGQAISQLNAAQTDQERQNATKAIADSIANLP